MPAVIENNIVFKAECQKHNSAINSHVVAAVRYGVRILKRTEEDLKEMERKSRKLLMMHGAHHLRTDAGRLYMKREDGEN